MFGEPYIIVRSKKTGELNAFFNVCAHHAAVVVDAPQGTAEFFKCPYHGWEYTTEGLLRKAVQMKGMKNFNPKEMGLKPLAGGVAAWGPFVFINFDAEAAAAVPLERALAPLQRELEAFDTHASLRFVHRKHYDLACNWKVFVDNYLDGGYHVAVAHPGLSGQLDLGSYTCTSYERSNSVQTCKTAAAGETHGDFSQRVGGAGKDAVYVFAYPNLLVNRYGGIMDTNLVLPLGAHRCRVVFDYYMSPDLAGDAAFVARALEASHKVQLEDQDLAERVQRGLSSSGYHKGRYAPRVEAIMYEFHRQLVGDLRAEHARPPPMPQLRCAKPPGAPSCSE